MSEHINLVQLNRTKLEEMISWGYEALEELHRGILNLFDTADMDMRIELEILIERVEAAMNSTNSKNLVPKPGASPKAEELYQDGLKYNSFNKIKKAAYMGMPEAINTLGFLYESGHGVAKNPAKAYRFYKLAADKDCPEAIKNLAYCYHKGLGVDKNINKAVSLYKQAATKGISEGWYRIGMMYYKGKDLTQDYKRALGYFNRAVNTGYGRAYIILGDMYRLGRGSRKSYTRAHDSYLEALKEARSIKDIELEKKATKRIRRLELIPLKYLCD